MIKCGFSKKNQRPYEMTNHRVLRQLGAQPCPLVCHSVFRFAVSATGSAQLHPRLTAAVRRTAVGSWSKASREKSQKEKAGLLTCSSFWLSLLDSGQRPYESKYSRKPVGLGTPFLLLLTCSISASLHPPPAAVGYDAD